MLVPCWLSVADGGPTLSQHVVNAFDCSFAYSGIDTWHVFWSEWLMVMTGTLKLWWRRSGHDHMCEYRVSRKHTHRPKNSEAHNVVALLFFFCHLHFFWFAGAKTNKHNYLKPTCFISFHTLSLKYYNYLISLIGSRIKIDRWICIPLIVIPALNTIYFGMELYDNNITNISLFQCRDRPVRGIRRL